MHGEGYRKKSGCILCQGIAARYALMKVWRTQYPLAIMAKVFDVSRSGFHAWLKRPPSKHQPGEPMVPRDYTKNCRMKALSLDATGWRACGRRWAFSANSAATSKSPRNPTMSSLWRQTYWTSTLSRRNPMPSGMWTSPTSPRRKAGVIMNTTPSLESGALQNFVRQLNLKTKDSTRVYRSVLGGFQRFVIQHSPNGVVSRQIIEGWLRDRSTVWPRHMVLHRARMVDRFLDWRVISGSLANNPLAQLRQDYGRNDTTSIVRALLAGDPASALEALRPPPRFASFLGSAMHDYILLMQAMGYRYATRAAAFLRLDRFLQNRPDLASQSLDVLIREWTGDAPTAQHAFECLSTVRILARALRRQAPSVAMPAMDPRLVQQARQAYRRPYIFTDEDVRRLLDTARSLPSPHAPLRPLTVYTMLVLSYCAGLRVGELAHLTSAPATPIRFSK